GEAVIILLDDPEFAVLLAEVPGGHLPSVADGFVNRRRLSTDGAIGPEHRRTAPGNTLQGSPGPSQGRPGRPFGRGISPAAPRRPRRSRGGRGTGRPRPPGRR